MTTSTVLPPLFILLLVTSEAPALTVDAQTLPGCTSATAIRAALEREPQAPAQLALVLTATTGRQIRLEVKLEMESRSATRRFVLRRRDCPLIPLLVAHVWERFLANLPAPAPARPTLAEVQGLSPAWPNRLRGALDLGFSPALLGGGARGALRAGLSGGPAGLFGWAIGLGYEVVPNERLGSGRAELHGGWVGAGLSGESRLLGLLGTGELLAVTGAAFGVGRGFDQDRLVVLPLGRARLAGRLILPQGGREGLAPHVGLALEASIFELSLVAPSGERYAEPLIRAELVVGLSWSGTRFR